MTLVDTVLPGSADEILEAAKNIGKPITRIVLTHAHHDHTGSLDAIKLALLNVCVYISHREEALRSGDLMLHEGEPDIPIPGRFPKHILTRADVLLQEGDRVGSLLALTTPGHTPGSMPFLDTRSHAFIAGDAFQTEGGIAVAGQIRPSFPYPAMGTWSKMCALESAHKLRGYQPSLLAVGHGKMLLDPCPDMDTAIAVAESSLY